MIETLRRRITKEHRSSDTRHEALQHVSDMIKKFKVGCCCCRCAAADAFKALFVLKDFEHDGTISEEEFYVLLVVCILIE